MAGSSTGSRRLRKQSAHQAIALIAVGAYTAVYTWVILKIVNPAVGLRVAAEEETEGLDQTQHGEKGYAL